MSLPQYPTYKASGAEWLGDVPSHWNVRRLGTLFRNVSDEGDLDLPILSVSIHDGVSDEELDDSALDRKVSRSDDRSKYKRVRPGDLVYNMMRAWQGAFGTVAVDGMVSPAYIVARPQVPISTSFVEHVLRTPRAIEEMRRHSRGVTDFRLRLYWDEFKAITVPVPPPEDVDTITSFIEQEGAQIEALISAQLRLAELLEDKKRAVIAHAVAKGLDLCTSTKSSGVQWLGDVPAHWDVVRMKFLCDIQTGTRDTEDAVDGGAYPFFVRSPVIERIDTASFNCEAVLTAGDGAGVGKVFHHYNGRFDAHQRVYVLNNFRRVLGGFLFEYLRAHFHKVALEGGAKSTVDSLRRPVFANFPVCVPPQDEQIAILHAIEGQSSAYDALIHEAERAVELLRQRRTALISAAVTGQIDVRAILGAQAAAA